MKAALDLVLFLLTGLAVSAGSLAAGLAGLCCAAAGGCWWWRRRRGSRRR
ncbi:hypothetical protein [Novosphingobium sp.]|nr:hypothetical protein [Novosphingobium sp.]